MGFRYASFASLLLGILCLPFWPYSRDWPVYLGGFFIFVGILLFLVSLLGKRGTSVWRHKGQG